MDEPTEPTAPTEPTEPTAPTASIVSGARLSTRHAWILFSVVFAGFLFQVDGCVVNISLPTLARHFGVSTGKISLVVLSYLLVVSSTLPLFGKLADRLGLRTVFLLGYSVFVSGTLLCGLAPGLGILLLARCVQGLGGAMLLTSAFAGIPRFMPPEVAGWSFGILSTASGIGLTVGAPLGGFVSGLLSWKWIFLGQVPIALVALAIGWKVVPREELPPAASAKPFDVPGTLLSILFLFPALYGLSSGHEAGWASTSTIACFVTALVSLAGLVAWERRCPDPIVSLELLRERAFVSPLLGRVVGSVASGGILFLLPFYLELAKGLRAEQSSLVLMVYSVVLMLVAPLAGKVSDHHPPRTVSSRAMLSGVLACAAFAGALYLPGLAPVLGFICWIALTYGFFFPSNNLLVMRAIPPHLLGSASGVLATAWTLGTSIGVSLFETVFAARVALAGAAPDAHGLASVPLPALLSGFRGSFLLGAIGCGVAMAYCLRSEAR